MRLSIGLAAATILLLAALVLGGASPSHAETVFFDDFESEPLPPVPPGYIDDYRDFANWDVSGPGVDLVGPMPWEPQVTSIMVDLDGYSGSTLVTKRSFDLMPGMQYTLTFDLLGPLGGTTLDTVVVSLGSAFSESITVEERAAVQTFSRTITPTTATTGRLSFTDLGADSNGVLLDNVRLDLVAVPEPCGLGLVVLGALGLGLGARRSGR